MSCHWLIVTNGLDLFDLVIVQLTLYSPHVTQLLQDTYTLLSIHYYNNIKQIEFVYN